MSSLLLDIPTDLVFLNQVILPFFNDGSCVHPRSITGIEIENGEISLIKWEISTKA